jgi:hypothetical protein
MINPGFYINRFLGLIVLFRIKQMQKPLEEKDNESNKGF